MLPLKRRFFGNIFSMSSKIQNSSTPLTSPNEMEDFSLPYFAFLIPTFYQHSRRTLESIVLPDEHRSPRLLKEKESITLL